MPLYEFQCTECHSSFEELVRVSALATEVACPKCGSRHVRRKVSTFASKGSSGSGLSSSAGSCAPSG
jgi:putative FmdB family regulatory protein